MYLYLVVTCSTFTRPMLQLGDVVSSTFNYDYTLNVACVSGYTLAGQNADVTDLICVVSSVDPTVGLWNTLPSDINCEREFT